MLGLETSARISASHLCPSTFGHPPDRWKITRAGNRGLFLRWGDTVTYLNTRDIVPHLSSGQNPVSADKNVLINRSRLSHI